MPETWKKTRISPPADTATVLVVEDNPSVRKLACNILTQNGYTVIESSRIDDAVEKAKSHEDPTRLVFTDVVMHNAAGGGKRSEPTKFRSTVTRIAGR